MAVHKSNGVMEWYEEGTAIGAWAEEENVAAPETIQEAAVAYGRALEVDSTADFRTFLAAAKMEWRAKRGRPRSESYEAYLRRTQGSSGLQFGPLVRG
jgi:hypothetical protein